MARPRKKTVPPGDALKDLILKSLDDDKAEEIVAIDLAGKSSIADYMVIANGRSSRQVAAMAEHLQERLKAAGHRPIGIEGQSQGDWVLVDAGDVIVHLFRPEVREHYNLEKMWGMPAADSAKPAVAAKPAPRARRKPAGAA